MSTIDQAARILKQRGGRELVIVSDQPARVMSEAGERIAEARAFAQWEINNLVEETAPGDKLADILLGEPVEYRVAYRLGDLQVRVIPGPSLWRVTLQATEEFASAQVDEGWLAETEEGAEQGAIDKEGIEKEAIAREGIEKEGIEKEAIDGRDAAGGDKGLAPGSDGSRAMESRHPADGTDQESDASPGQGLVSDEAHIQGLGLGQTPGHSEPPDQARVADSAGGPLPAIHWIEDDHRDQREKRDQRDKSGRNDPKDREDVKETFAIKKTGGRLPPEKDEEGGARAAASDPFATIAVRDASQGQDRRADHPDPARRHDSGTFLGMPNPTPNAPEPEDDDTGDPFAWDEDLDSMPSGEIEAYRSEGPDAAPAMEPSRQPGGTPAGALPDGALPTGSGANAAERERRTPTADLSEPHPNRRASDSSRTMRAIRRPGDPGPSSSTTSRSDNSQRRESPRLPGLFSLLDAAVKTGAFELRIIEGQRPWMRTGRGFGPLPQAQVPVRAQAFDELEQNLGREEKRALEQRGWVRFMWDGGLQVGLTRCTLLASRPRSLVVHLHVLAQRSRKRLGLSNDILRRAAGGGMTILAGPGTCGRTTLATALLENILSSGLKSAVVAGIPPELQPNVTAPVILFDRSSDMEDSARAMQAALASGTEAILWDDGDVSDLDSCLSAAAQGMTVIAVQRSASLQSLVRELAEAAFGLSLDAPELLAETVRQILFLEPDNDLRRRSPRLSVLVPSKKLWTAHTGDGIDAIAATIEQDLVSPASDDEQ